MCITANEGPATPKCDNCPMGESRLCAFEISDIGDQELQEAETFITTWAAEHPEPVYPTWYRWLIMMGAIGSVGDLFFDLQREIPADIAQKLGIEPEEGKHGNRNDS